jgi:Tol biopolymer transport system component
MVVEQVAGAFGGLGAGIAHFDVSPSGVLVYLPGAAGSGGPLRIALAGRDGKIEPIDVPPQQYAHPRISPDGRQLAIVIDDGRGVDVWVYDDLKARATLRRLTFGGRNQYPIWTRDSRFITFQSDRDGDRAVFKQLADGSGPAERLTTPENGVAHEPESWSPDGKVLSMNVVKAGDQSVWTTTVEPGAKPRPFTTTPAVEKHSSFSPDGRWLAYMANSGNEQWVLIQPFPLTGATYQINSPGARAPVWSPDGRQLIFHNPGPNRLIVVDVHADKGLTFGPPMPLPIEDTVHPIAQRNYDVTPDGKQFVVILPAQAQSNQSRAAQTQFNVVLNWFEELSQRAPIR